MVMLDRTSVWNTYTGYYIRPNQEKSRDISQYDRCQFILGMTSKGRYL
jgi:hypothetical protein